jgi:hypothetical protein
VSIGAQLNRDEGDIISEGGVWSSPIVKIADEMGEEVRQVERRRLPQAFEEARVAEECAAKAGRFE